MSFSGIRYDDLLDKYDTSHPSDNGNFTAIALNTSNPKIPGFMFANGTKIEFNNASGNWDVASWAEREVQVGLEWLLLLLMAGLASVFLP